MNLRSFHRSLESDSPPDDLAPAMSALWHGKRGDWERAHSIVQGEDGRDCAWVHAWLHRVEGDMANARYWYDRAGKDARSEPADEEWRKIVIELLRSDG